MLGRITPFFIALPAFLLSCTSSTDETGFGGMDGVSSEDSPTPSSATATPSPESVLLVFTEVMADPSAVPDGDGEWMELYNPSVRDIELDGFFITNSEGNAFALDGIKIRPYEYLVLGRNAAYEENGGVQLSATYAGGFILSNATEVLTLFDADERIIDEIAWSEAPQGASLSLDPSQTSVEGNDDSDNLCPTRWATLAQGDKGTPGALNDPCFPSGEAGSVIFVEIMANPSAVDDAFGEYLELYNTSNEALRLDDWTLFDGSGGSHILNADGDLWIEPGGLLLLGNHFESSENGGLSLDYSWQGEISLDDFAAQVQLYAGDVLIDEVRYGASSFPSTPEGASLQLDPDAFDALSNDEGGAWCISTTLLDESAADSDYGTAGVPNPSCSP